MNCCSFHNRRLLFFFSPIFLLLWMNCLAVILRVRWWQIIIRYILSVTKGLQTIKSTFLLSKWMRSSSSYSSLVWKLLVSIDTYFRLLWNLVYLIGTLLYGQYSQNYSFWGWISVMDRLSFPPIFILRLSW